MINKERMLLCQVDNKDVWDKLAFTRLCFALGTTKTTIARRGCREATTGKLDHCVMGAGVVTSSD